LSWTIRIGVETRLIRLKRLRQRDKILGYNANQAPARTVDVGNQTK